MTPQQKKARKEYIERRKYEGAKFPYKGSLQHRSR
jgi:hypothetical protein